MTDSSKTFDPPRRGPRAPVVVEAHVVDGAQRYVVSTRDLSLGGVRLSMPAAPWKPRARLSLRMLLRVDQSGATQEVTLACAVVWCSDRELGAEFVDLDPVHRAPLERAVATALLEVKSFENEPTPAA